MLVIRSLAWESRLHVMEMGTGRAIRIAGASRTVVLIAVDRVDLLPLCVRHHVVVGIGQPDPVGVKMDPGVGASSPGWPLQLARGH